MKVDWALTDYASSWKRYDGFAQSPDQWAQQANRCPHLADQFVGGSMVYGRGGDFPSRVIRLLYLGSNVPEDFRHEANVAQIWYVFEYGRLLA
jgi:hypothetical protein